jgi:phospholipid transport system substrate-binding protein
MRGGINATWNHKNFARCGRDHSCAGRMHATSPKRGAGLEGSAMLRHSLLAALVLAAVTAPEPPAGAADPASFIAGLDSRLERLVADTPPEQRAPLYRDLLNENFDVPLIAHFVFGRYWRTASPAERAQLLGLFEDHLVQGYADRLTEYADGGWAPVILGCRVDPDGAAVSSEVVLGRGPTQGGRGAPLAPIRVDWRLVAENGTYKIVDVVVDGVSMATTERAEFAAEIERQGGELPEFLAVVQRRSAGVALR